MTTEKKNLNWEKVFKLSAVFAAVSVIIFVLCIISGNLTASTSSEAPVQAETAHYTIMDSFEAAISGDLSVAYEAASGVPRVFWIPEDAEIAPKPNQSCYGESKDPKELQWVLDSAKELLNGQETVFSTDIEIFPGSTITYYLDESILVITWQQLIDNYCYTYSEVKISHPSQFGRYLGNNEFDSLYLHPASRLGAQANAVMAASADFYMARTAGIVVYQGEVKRTDYSEYVDTCFIDKNADLILVPAGTFNSKEEAQKFVDDNDILFSLAFGPILVDNGVRCEPDIYYLGETNDKYPRVALCQKDKLHYVVVTANGQLSYQRSINIHTFAKVIAEMNCQKAYTLDGGRTGTIAMNGKALNPVEYERWISDIIFFATAIPSPEEPAVEAPAATTP